MFFHFQRGFRMPLKSAAGLLPPLPSCSSSSTRHASMPYRRGTSVTKERPVPSHLVMNRARIFLLVCNAAAPNRSFVTKPAWSAATSKLSPMPAKSEQKRNFVREESQFASLPAKFGMLMVVLVSRMALASALVLQVPTHRVLR